MAQAIGGLETLADYLADDYELSAAVIRAGYKAELAHSVVETFVADYTLRSFVDHQLRWGRAVRASRPASYVGFLPMFGFLWCLILLVVMWGSAWAWLIFAAFCAVRVASVYFVSYRVAGDVNAWRNLWLLPLRDLIAPTVWFASLFGNKIVWRGDVFKLEKGKLRKAST